MELLIHGLAILLQLLAVALALYTIRISGRALAWLLLCAAFMLMAVRRVLEYLVMVGALETTATHYAQDWLGLAVSLLIVAGVYHIRKLFVARAQAEAELRESETRLTTILESVQTGVVIIDPETHQIVYANSVAANLIGAPKEQIVGSVCHRFICPAEKGRCPITDLGQAIDNSERVLLSAAGKRRPIIKTVVTVILGGRECILESFIDISERKQAEDRLKESRARLERSLRGTIDAIARLTELRDPFIEKHQQHVARLAAAIAQEMGLAEERVEGIRLAATIHDLGLIALPFEVLAKRQDLTAAERGLYQTHPETGYAVLADIDFPWPIAAVVRQHHENLDGSGYPAGLKGDEILPEARIVNVANVFAEMVADRAAQPPVALDEALERLAAGRGSLYDPDVVDACARLFRERGMTLA